MVGLREGVLGREPSSTLRIRDLIPGVTFRIREGADRKTRNHPEIVVRGGFQGSSESLQRSIQRSALLRVPTLPSHRPLHTHFGLALLLLLPWLLAPRSYILHFPSAPTLLPRIL